MYDAREHLDYLEESLAENETQYRAEVLMFGDAWPGASEDLERLRRGIRKLKEKIGPVEVPVREKPVEPDDGIPF